MSLFQQNGRGMTHLLQVLGGDKSISQRGNVLPLHARYPSQSSCTIIQFCFADYVATRVLLFQLLFSDKAIGVHVSLHTCANISRNMSPRRRFPILTLVV